MSSEDVVFTRYDAAWILLAFVSKQVRDLRSLTRVEHREHTEASYFHRTLPRKGHLLYLEVGDQILNYELEKLNVSKSLQEFEMKTAPWNEFSSDKSALLYAYVLGHASALCDYCNCAGLCDASYWARTIGRPIVFGRRKLQIFKQE